MGRDEQLLFFRELLTPYCLFQHLRCNSQTPYLREHGSQLKLPEILLFQAWFEEFNIQTESGCPVVSDGIGKAEEIGEQAGSTGQGLLQGRAQPHFGAFKRRWVATRA